MAKLAYWMVFQILIGAWLFASPFIFGYSGEMTTMTTNSMIFGAVVALLGLGIAIFHKEVCGGVEQTSK
jgi:ABC-type uncharacterized transport system permease subunit